MRRFIVSGSALVSILVLSASGQARSAGTPISIRAKTSNKPFEHMVYDTYGQNATIYGTIATGEAGKAVQLQASTFPYTSGFSVLAQTTTLAGGVYSFPARPVLATRYRVVLMTDSSSSPVITVYVAPAAANVSRGRCSAVPSCTLRFAVDFVYPPPAVSHEIGKRAYYYFGIRYGSNTIPPKRLRRVRTGAQRHVAGNRYRAAFRYSFATPAGRRYRFEWIVCIKDTEAADGLGLPGHHHCGARYVRWSDVRKGWIG